MSDSTSLFDFKATSLDGEPLDLAAYEGQVVLVATEDLERCPPGSVFDQVEGHRFVVCGEVEEIEADAVVLDLGDRRVRVLLDGHRNPAGYQQPVRATGTLRG